MAAWMALSALADAAPAAEVHALIWEVVARWHQGQLLFEGTRRGAVLNVILPPFSC